MHRRLACAAVIALTACTQTPPDGPQVPDHAKNLVPGCYTVDLFDPYRLQYPEQQVSKDRAAFIGVWKQGGWNGEWCHDLYITAVRADGSADVLDAYGPLARHGIDATVFRREATFEGDELVVQGGRGVSRYRLRDGFLLGNRRDLNGRYSITMTRADGLTPVPIPQPRPTRLAAR